MVTCCLLCSLCFNFSVIFYFKGFQRVKLRKYEMCLIDVEKRTAVRRQTLGTANDGEKLIEASYYCEDTEL